jgi:type IV pilus assembly protein PilA
MLTSIKHRLNRDDEQGFTLIELMVVVLIIAILLAIAIPTFLGARNSANARGAQSNLRNALTAEQTLFTNGQAFGDSTSAGGVTALAAVEPNLGWGATATRTPPNSILAVSATPFGMVVLTAEGADNNCYSIAQINQAATGATAAPAGTYYEQSVAPTGGCLTPTAPVLADSTAALAKASANVGAWAQAF